MIVKYSNRKTLNKTVLLNCCLFLLDAELKCKIKLKLDSFGSDKENSDNEEEEDNEVDEEDNEVNEEEDSLEKQEESKLEETVSKIEKVVEPVVEKKSISAKNRR
jgi:Skp family chaperone for outer membrane proteins